MQAQNLLWINQLSPLRVWVPVPRLLDPMIILEHILVYNCSSSCSPSDQGVQGSVAAGKAGAPPDEKGMVTNPSSGSGVP